MRSIPTFIAYLQEKFKRKFTSESVVREKGREVHIVKGPDIGIMDGEY